MTIHDIAYEVGVTEAAIYRHFRSKREIFSYVIHKWKESFLNTVQSDPESSVTALERLEQAFWIQLSEVQDHRALSSLIIVEAISFEGAGTGTEVAAVVTAYLEAVREILETGIQEGSIRSNVDLDAAATTLFGMIQSTATLWALNNYNTPLARRGAQMWEIFKRGIASMSDISTATLPYHGAEVVSP